MIRNKFH